MHGTRPPCPVIICCAAVLLEAGAGIQDIPKNDFAGLLARVHARGPGMLLTGWIGGNFLPFSAPQLQQNHSPSGTSSSPAAAQKGSD